jgi:hypothetical protein
LTVSPPLRGRDDGSGVQRLPVEVIPHSSHVGFSEVALLQDDFPVAPVRETVSTSSSDG